MIHQTGGKGIARETGLSVTRDGKPPNVRQNGEVGKIGHIVLDRTQGSVVAVKNCNSLPQA